MTERKAIRPQLYVVPMPDGWAVECHGIDGMAGLAPLPLTSAVDYAEVLEFVAALPVARGAIVDGWATLDELKVCEPSLWAEVAR